MQVNLDTLKTLSSNAIIIIHKVDVLCTTESFRVEEDPLVSKISRKYHYNRSKFDTSMKIGRYVADMVLCVKDL